MTKQIFYDELEEQAYLFLTDAPKELVKSLNFFLEWHVVKNHLIVNGFTVVEIKDNEN